MNNEVKIKCTCAFDKPGCPIHNYHVEMRQCICACGCTVLTIQSICTPCTTRCEKMEKLGQKNLIEHLALFVSKQGETDEERFDLLLREIHRIRKQVAV